jgi:hypothetical protein
MVWEIKVQEKLHLIRKLKMIRNIVKTIWRVNKHFMSDRQSLLFIVSTVKIRLFNKIWKFMKDNINNNQEI